MDPFNENNNIAQSSFGMWRIQSAFASVHSAMSKASNGERTDGILSLMIGKMMPKRVTSIKGSFENVN